MGKSLPRKCNSCEKTYKTNFVKHAKKCPAGFTEWTFLDHAGDEIPEENLKKMPNRVHGAFDGVRADTRSDALTEEARAWSKFKRLGVRACTRAQCIKVFKHTVKLIQGHPKIQQRDLKLMSEALKAMIKE